MSTLDARIEAVRRGFRQGFQEGVLETLAQATTRFPADPALAAWAADVKAKVEADHE